MRSVRKTGSHDVYGVRLQRRRGYGVSDNLVAERKAYRDFDELFCAVQRAVSAAYFRFYDVCRRFVSFFVLYFGGVAFRCYLCGRNCNALRVEISFGNFSSRRTVGFYS